MQQTYPTLNPAVLGDGARASSFRSGGHVTISRAARWAAILVVVPEGFTGLVNVGR